MWNTTNTWLVNSNRFEKPDFFGLLWEKARADISRSDSALLSRYFFKTIQCLCMSVSKTLKII